MIQLPFYCIFNCSLMIQCISQVVHDRFNFNLTAVYKRLTLLCIRYIEMFTQDNFKHSNVKRKLQHLPPSATQVDGKMRQFEMMFILAEEKRSDHKTIGTQLRYCLFCCYLLLLVIASVSAEIILFVQVLGERVCVCVAGCGYASVSSTLSIA